MTVHFPNSNGTNGDLAEVLNASPRGGVYRRGTKRVFDVAFVLVVSFFIVPTIATIALLIVLTDGRSPFFLQERVGKGGRAFRMIKLRSMVPDADRKLAGYLRTNPAARAEWERDQKLRNDPRITRIGHFIRKCSLDELPQFWNVLVGHMSVVGPRPMMPAQRDLYREEAYFLMRPGVTGFWQVSARNTTSFAARAHYDVEYYARMSLAVDLMVILRTLRVMLRGTGC